MDERAKKELELYYENLKIFKVIDGLKAMCQEIYQEYEQQQQERQWKSRNTPQFMGGGFGITGALKGAFQAELLNMGIRSLNSISNSIGSARTEYKMRKKLDDFFDDPNTKWKIKAVVYEDMIGFYFVAHSIINRKITLREKCFNYDRSDSNQAHELYMRVTNVDAYVSDFKEKMEKLLAEPYSCYTHAMARKAYEAFYEELRNSNARDDIRTLLKLFPMKSSYFKLYFDRVNEIDRDIQAYAEMCGYDVSKDIP